MATKLDRTKLVRNLATGNVLAPFLEREFERFDEPFTFTYTTKEHDDAWHPSGDCLPVASALYEKATSQDEEIHTSTLRKSFMVGHYWHQVIQYIILHKLEFCAPEAIERRGLVAWGFRDTMKPKPYQWVVGSGDIAPLKTPKWQGIVDIKTMSSNQFKQNKIPDWAADKYLCQLNMYMHLFDEDKALILAVNKDAPHDFKEFSYIRDQQLIDAIFKKWNFVGECIATETVPTKQDDKEYSLPIVKKEK